MVQASGISAADRARPVPRASGPGEARSSGRDNEPWPAIGHSGPARLSAYRGGVDRWRVVVENRPADLGWTSAVSAGGGPGAGAGAVALYDDRVGVLFDDGSWHAAPTDVLAMSRLSDATPVADPHSLQGMWLGTRQRLRLDPRHRRTRVTPTERFLHGGWVGRLTEYFRASRTARSQPASAP